MAGGGMVKALNANQMPTTPEITPTPETPPSPGGGGKGAGRVSPTVESRPMFQNQDSMFGRLLNRETPPTPVTPPPSYFERNPGLDNPVFRGLVKRQNQERFQPVLDNAFQQAALAPGYRNESTPPVTPPTPSGGGGKGSGMVSPVVESRPMFQNQKQEFPPEIRPYVNSLPGVSAASQPILPQPVLGQQLSEQPQQSITGMNTNTGSTNSMPAPQSAIFKKGGLIGLMRKR